MLLNDREEDSSQGCSLLFLKQITASDHRNHGDPKSTVDLIAEFDMETSC